jgi:hypothetical protein
VEKKLNNNLNNNTMQTMQVFTYKNQEIEFDPSSSALMVNATEMAKIFGKRTDVFLKTDHAQAFIKVLKLPPNGGSLGIKSTDDIIQERGRNGLWMHRILALKFAAWLDPNFELWVYQTIDEILFGAYRRMEESLRLSAQRKNRIDELKNALGVSSEFLELQRLELEERQASYGRTKENRNQLDLFRVAP